MIFLALDISDELLSILRNFCFSINFDSKKAYLIYKTENENQFKRKRNYIIESFTREGINRLINNYDTKSVESLRYALRYEDNFINQDLMNTILNSKKVVEN